MLYSSGTTGRPKGVKRGGNNLIAVDGAIDAPSPLAMLGQALYGWNPDMRYLSPAPLYHAPRSAGPWRSTPSAAPCT
jgi:long-chain acyl-CoA synthetase